MVVIRANFDKTPQLRTWVLGSTDENGIEFAWHLCKFGTNFCMNSFNL